MGLLSEGDGPWMMWPWFDVPVEYGPTASDVRHYFLKAPDAKTASKYALSRYRYDFPYHSPMVSQDAIRSITEEEAIENL